MNSSGSAICGRCFAVYQEGYGHVCATAQADWRSLADDLAAALREIEIDTNWAEDEHRSDPKALRYALQMTRTRAGLALERYSQARGDK